MSTPEPFDAARAELARSGDTAAPQLWLPQRLRVPPSGALAAWLWRSEDALKRLDLPWLLRRLLWPHAGDGTGPRDESPVLMGGWHIDCERRVLRHIGPRGHGDKFENFIDLQANPSARLHLGSAALGGSAAALSLLGLQSQRDVTLAEFETERDSERVAVVVDFVKLLAEKIQLPLTSVL